MQFVAWYAKLCHRGYMPKPLQIASAVALHRARGGRDASRDPEDLADPPSTPPDEARARFVWTQDRVS